jgi:resolvase-like protein
VVAKLDRLSRSMIEFTALIGLARRQRWPLVALGALWTRPPPAGEAMANVLSTFAVTTTAPRIKPLQTLLGDLQRAASRISARTVP